MDKLEFLPGLLPRPIIVARPGHPISREKIDADALKILFRLHRQGFLAFLVGGAVRDLMLGRTPKDFDIVTDARPGQIRKRFANAYIIGRRFRLAHIHFAAGKIIEVATFRRALFSVEDEVSAEGSTENPAPAQEMATSGGIGTGGLQGLAGPAASPAPAAPARPEDLYGTPTEDAFRRDITINALFYDPVDETVIDYVGGLEDLARRRVRMIGDPAGRYIEDPVRMWRVLRHAARLGFAVDEAAEEAIASHVHLLASCAGSRLYEELNKDLAYETGPVLDALHGRGILPIVLGKIGRAYETDARRFGRMRGLVSAADEAKAHGHPLGLDDMQTILFWPWIEPLFEKDDLDLHYALHEEFRSLESRTIFPKKMRADIIQIILIAGHMLRSLRSGRMRWALRHRAHYPQASRLVFLLREGRYPARDESFESLFQRAFPGGGMPAGKPRRRRRRPRENNPVPEPRS